MIACPEINLVVDDSFPLRIFYMDGSTRYIHHWHDEIEIIYCTEGTIKLGINDELYILQKDELVLIGSQAIHYFLPTSGGKAAVFQFKLSIFENLYSSPKERLELIKLFDTTCKLNSSWGDLLRAKVNEHFNNMILEFEGKDFGYKLAVRARLYDIVVLLLRHLPIDNQTQELSKITSEKRFIKVFHYVQQHYDENIDLIKIAKIEGFSVYHFSRQFKAYTGMTFIDYLNHFRVTMSEWFLLNQNLTITEIALKVGFGSVSQYNKVFKKIKGYAPTQYKKAKYEEV